MTLKRIFFILMLLAYLQILSAAETDQFTLAPFELYDFGETASQRLYTVIDEARNKTNLEIQRLLPKAKTNQTAASKLALRLQEEYIVDLIYSKCNPGYPSWLLLNDSAKQGPPILYREILPWKTVYWLVFSQIPVSFFSLSPTIRMYDYYFGTDKIEHFFHQGYDYYKRYKGYLAQHKTMEEARANIVKYGQMLEWTYLGSLLNGVFSNADLVANYSGWKFYMNLTHEICINEHNLAPILILRNNFWEFSPQVDKDTLFKTFLSDGLNEALNPCYYFFMRNLIRRHVKERCANWVARMGITPKIVQAKLIETSSWYGEDYGHWLPKDEAVTLDVCFND